MKVGLKKLPGLSKDENGMLLWLLVLSQYQRVMNGQMDRPPIAKLRSSIAERDKKETYILLPITSR